MTRRRQSDIVDALPKFRATQEDISLAGGTWDLEKSDLKQTLSCQLRLEGYKASDYVGRTYGHWNLTIIKRKNSRGKLGRGWEAYVTPQDKTVLAEMIGRGSDKGWEEPIKMLPYFGVVRALRKLGAAIYKKENFIPIRPFKVMYPWRNPEEPNAKYSPFTYCGDVYDTETDGVVVHQYTTNQKAPVTYDLRHFVTETLRANAIVTDPDPQGWCDLWHRNDMSVVDRIHIDDWRARLIAGSE
jgi:hypothetical protein